MDEERRCLIIDEHPTIRLGVRRLLADRYAVEEASDGRDALEMLAFTGEFDVAIVELSGHEGGDLSGLSAIRALRKARPGLGIVAHGTRAGRHAASEAIAAGATAFVAKSSPSESLLQAVEAAANSERFIDPEAEGQNGSGQGLTRRQREILQLFSTGHTTADVATRLGVSTETVRTHTKAVLARLDAHDRTHAVAIGLRSSLIE